jgi:hypothetical protein
LNMWYMRWGNKQKSMKMVRKFAEKDSDSPAFGPNPAKSATQAYGCKGQFS